MKIKYILLLPALLPVLAATAPAATTQSAAPATQAVTANATQTATANATQTVTANATQAVTATAPQPAPSAQKRYYYAPAAEVYAEDPWIVCGNYALYDFSVQEETPVPKGFKPFYITTYNRHGARTYGSDSGYDLWYRVLSLAKEEDLLTPRGEDLYREFMAIYPLTANRGGDLTPIGHEQLRALGEHVYRSCPEVFKARPVVDACSTTVPRVMLSMAEFCDGMKTCDPALDIRQRAAQPDRAVLVPTSSTNPRVTGRDRKFDSKEIWGKGYWALMYDHIDPQAMLSRYFKDTSVALKGGRSEPMEVCRVLYNLAADLPCVTAEHDLMQFLTRNELFYFWRAENYRFYNVAGRTPLHQGRNWALHEILLRDIIDRAEEDMAAGELGARLRFGHDFNIISLLTLLDVDGWNLETADPEEVDAVFRHYAVPMGSNIRFVFYRNDLGDVLVKALYNERELHFRIAGFSGPYYPWTTFKAFCESRTALADKILQTTR